MSEIREARTKEKNFINQCADKKKNKTKQKKHKKCKWWDRRAAALIFKKELWIFAKNAFLPHSSVK